MTFENLWPLFLLILIPIIILLYMLKQKANDLSFSSVMLWKEVYKNIEATKPWEKLKQNLLMYLQILTVLILIFALMAPYLKTGGTGYSNVILVIDNSGSMSTSYNDKRTRLEEAKDRACDYVNSLGDSASITVIASADKGTILLSGMTDKSEIKKRINDISETDLGGDLNDSMSLVDSVSSQWDDCSTVLFTDSKADIGSKDYTVINLYSEVDNLSLDYVSYGFEDGKMVVIAKVTNYSGKEAITDINLYGKDELLDVGQIVVPPNDSNVIYFNDVQYDGGYLTAEINNKDGLISDNKASAVLNGSSMPKVLIISDGNVFLEKAFQSSGMADVYKTDSVDSIDEANPFDIYVFDGDNPTTEIEGNYLFVNPKSDESITVDKTLDSAMLTFGVSDITSYVNGYEFGVGQVKLLKKPLWATSFLECEDGCVGYYGEYSGKRIVVLGFDIHNTDFALQPEYPILMSSILDYLSNGGLVNDGRYVTGDSISINANMAGSDVTVVSPYEISSSYNIDSWAGNYVDTQRAGVYKVTQDVKDKEEEGFFVVDYPVDSESAIVSGEEHESEKNQSTKLNGGRELRNIIIIVCLLLLAVEWVVYIRQR